MRLVGTFQRKEEAQLFADALCVQELDNEVRAGQEESNWGVWIIDNKHLPQAKEWLERFLENPNAKEFQGVGAQAQKKRKEEEEGQKDFRRMVHDRESLFGGTELGKLTLILIGICGVVAVLSRLGQDRNILNYLLITHTEVVGQYIRWSRGMPDVMQHGQVWRLVTPIFIHFGFIHLLFNMLWLKDLGSMVEQRQKAWYLGLLVLVVAIASNLAQFAVSGPNFGGMSGVVYGLLGYIWIRGRFDPLSGLHIRRETVVMMIIWFFVCLSGVVGNIANTAHAVGLGVGVAWGFLSAQWVKQRRRQSP